jgi:hypothetical protein
MVFGCKGTNNNRIIRKNGNKNTQMEQIGKKRNERKEILSTLVPYLNK